MQPRRRFIKEGKIIRNDKEVIVFVFTDGIMYCTPKKKDKVKYQGFIQLGTASLTTGLFTILCNQ